MERARSQHPLIALDAHHGHVAETQPEQLRHGAAAQAEQQRSPRAHVRQHLPPVAIGLIGGSTATDCTTPSTSSAVRPRPRLSADRHRWLRVACYHALNEPGLRAWQQTRRRQGWTFGRSVWSAAGSWARASPKSLPGRASTRSYARSTKQALQRGVERIERSLGTAVQRGKLSQADRDTAWARIEPTTDLGAFSECDLVIEAVIEQIDEKRHVYRALDDACPPHAILASNTSSIPIVELANSTETARQGPGHSLHESRPSDAAGGACSSHHDERRDPGHGADAVRRAGQEGHRRAGPGRLHREPHPGAVPTGRRAALRFGSRYQAGHRSRTRPMAAGCRWGRSRWPISWAWTRLLHRRDPVPGISRAALYAATIAAADGGRPVVTVASQVRASTTTARGLRTAHPATDGRVRSLFYRDRLRSRQYARAFEDRLSVLCVCA